MRFALTDEQRGFARSLDDLLADADVSRVIRDWADGTPGPGLALWRRMADVGVTGLLVPGSAGGLDAGPVDAVVAFEAIGRYAVPGPWIESVACLPRLLAGLDAERWWLADLAEGRCVGTITAPPLTPHALDADAADRAFLLDGRDLGDARAAGLRRSVDPARRLFTAEPASPVGRLGEPAVSGALDMAVLACSAQLLGLGERLLATSVAYATSRRQFGRPIGEYQALKHAMADVRVAQEFARPLVYGAALSIGCGSALSARDVSAAKVAAGAAAYRAARTALQTHGAIGYTAEYDLGLWIAKVRALVGAWGTASLHRARIMESLEQERS